MSPEDRVSSIADCIADGGAIDWPADTSTTDPNERATLEALKEIAALATLHRRPLDFAPGATAPEGRPWGPLTITSPIGAGRFGQVYLAWDARLQRRVALKLLFVEAPAASASPAHAIEEARLLARVRHPNVLAVYGAECIDNQIGIWTEFIEGRTLEDLLDQRGPMAPDDVVSIGLDLCRALGAVHDAGLLHRDIKLQNVMRETGGRIVLMDFGTGHDLEARPTRPGDLSGTPLYLAPEILAGGEATQASDVYALAVLLFRLLTGEYPVPGRTLDDVRVGHRRGSGVKLRDARSDLPAPLIDAIDHGLASDPAQRHSSAAAFASALVPDIARPRDAPVPRVRDFWIRHWQPATAATLAAIGIIGAGAFALSVANRATNVVAKDDGSAKSDWALRPLTSDGQAPVADISADGKLVAYLHGGRRTVRVLDAVTGDSRLVYTAVASRMLRGATLAPNGSWIDVLDTDRDLWRVPLSGRDEPRKIATHVATPPGWAPDGQRMAILIAGPLSGLSVFDKDLGSRRDLDSFPGSDDEFIHQAYPIFPATNRPAWSPDGRTLALVSVNKLLQSAAAQIVLADVESGHLQVVTAVTQRAPYPPAILQVVWLDQTHLIVNHQNDGLGPYQLSQFDLEDHAFMPITHGTAEYRGVAIAGDRQTVVSTAMEPRSGIWAGDGSIIVSESSSRPQSGAFDTAGNFVYSREMPYGTEVHTLPAGATTSSAIARGADPTVTPDGEVVFVATNGRPGLYRSNRRGADTTLILRGAFSMPAVTPNGRTVFYVAPIRGVQAIWSVAIAGGQAREVVDTFAVSPRISHDGHRLLYQTSKLTVVVCDLPDCSHPDKLVMGPARRHPVEWAPDDRGAAFVRMGAGTDNIWVQPFDGGPPRQVTTFKDDRIIHRFAWSPDGKKLAVTRGTTGSDVVVFTRGKEDRR